MLILAVSALMATTACTAQPTNDPTRSAPATTATATTTA